MRNRFLRKFEIIQAEEYISFQKFNTSDNDILLLYGRLNIVFDTVFGYQLFLSNCHSFFIYSLVEDPSSFISNP